jgi:hypothetical protein
MFLWDLELGAGTVITCTRSSSLHAAGERIKCSNVYTFLLRGLRQ